MLAASTPALWSSPYGHASKNQAGMELVIEYVLCFVVLFFPHHNSVHLSNLVTPSPPFFYSY